MIDLDKTVFSGGRASLLRPLPSFRNGAARTGRRDFLGLVGLYTGAKVRLFRRTGKKSAFYSLRPPEKQLFRHLSLVFPSLFQAPHPIHIAVTHHIIEASTPRRSGKVLSPPPEGAAEAASGGARASSGGTSPRSPPDEGETPRGRSKATGGSPVGDAAARRVGGSVARESPQSSTRIRSGGGRRWSTCIKRWNVATLSPRRRGDTRGLPKATGGSPVRDAAARRAGGSGARENPQSSTRIRSGGGRRWSTCIKRWNVATLSPRRRGDTARPISTQPEESAGRLPGWIKIPSRPGTCIRRGSRAPQAADHRRGERAKRGETTSRRRTYSPAGMAGCAPEAGGSSVAMGDCPLSAGKNSTPSVPPGRWAVRRKRINVDIWKKLT